MLSGTGLGQGSGKVFGNIGGPVTLKIHCKESIVAGQERSHTISKVQNELPTKSRPRQREFWCISSISTNLHTRRKTLPSKKGTKLASQQNQASSKGILVLLSRNIPQNLFTRQETLFPAPRTQRQVAVIGVLNGLLA